MTATARRPRLLPTVAAGVLCAATLLGCSSSGPSAAPLPGAAPSVAGVPSAKACPTPTTPPAQWPLSVPADLPKPPGAVISKTSQQGKATYVTFRTPTSIRESVLFVVNGLRAAGYTLSRGDAEPTEADAPFTGTKVYGAMKMVLTDVCETAWVLAVVPRDGTAPVPAATLLPYTPGASAAPLPFG